MRSLECLEFGMPKVMKKSFDRVRVRNTYILKDEMQYKS